MPFGRRGWGVSGLLLLVASGCAHGPARARRAPITANHRKPASHGGDERVGDVAEMTVVRGGPAVQDDRSAPRLQWAVDDPVVINFYGWRGKRRLRMHEGIDVRARTGTPIFASDDGRVIHAGTGIRGYGKVIIIDHGEGWTTLYAHLSRVEVRRGDRVQRGERIALSGRTGRANGPHLHFEIRKGADPFDPLLFLPPAPSRSDLD